jgi:predicted dehydrogenase
LAEQARWGILGPGSIAGWLARGIKESSNGGLIAVGSRQQANADRFGDEHNVPRRYGSYEALLADPDVDVVYVATPHPMHLDWAIRVAEAGKHVLVEKPIGMNRDEAVLMIAAANDHDVFLMEAFMYRCHPQTERLIQLLEEGVIGEVGLIHSTFSYHTNAAPESRAFNLELGGGGILDVGCYPASLARLVAGRAVGKPFANPTEVKAVAHFHATGADNWSAASIKFPSGILAQISCGVQLNTMQDPQLRVFGSEGMLQIADPWQPSRFNREPSTILLKRNGESAQEIRVDAPKMLYTYEAENVVQHIQERESPAMTWDDTLGNMRLLDRWRAEIGLQYDADQDI